MTWCCSQGCLYTTLICQKSLQDSKQNDIHASAQDQVTQVPLTNDLIRIILFTVVAYTAGAPALLLSHDADLIHAVPLNAKSTITRSNQVVDHGSTLIHTPVIPLVHTAPLHVASVHIPSSKTTVTKSSQVVNHGGSAVVHSVPVIHSVPIVHSVPLSTHDVHHSTLLHNVPSKTTVTKSNQVVNHGSTTLIHTHIPVVHTAPVVAHSAPVLVQSAPVLAHSAPLLSLKTGDSAISHHSSTVHETVPIVKSLPVYALHH
ncbi:uncharacterized protein ACR2FA_005982 [Aphomia sociella]